MAVCGGEKAAAHLQRRDGELQPANAAPYSRKPQHERPPPANSEGARDGRTVAAPRLHPAASVRLLPLPDRPAYLL